MTAAPYPWADLDAEMAAVDVEVRAPKTDGPCAIVLDADDPTRMVVEPMLQLALHRLSGVTVPSGQSERDIPITVYVSPRAVMRVQDVARRTAYRLLKEARGGREGRTTLVEWERYARRRWGHGQDGDVQWDDREKGFGSDAEAASGSPRSTSLARGSNAVLESGTKQQLPEWLGSGTKRAKLRVARPRHAPSTRR